MNELISNPGLRFVLYKLKGSLTYTHARDGKPAKQYNISDADFEETSCSQGDDAETSRLPRSGVHASAVGCQLLLIKNEGVLQITFEGKMGASANWTFRGLDSGTGNAILASAGTQTYTDPDHCIACRHKMVVPSSIQDTGTQTDTMAVTEMGTQTDGVYTAEVRFPAGEHAQSRVDSELPTDQVSHDTAQSCEAHNTDASVTTHVQNATTTNGTDIADAEDTTSRCSSQNLKRKASSESPAATLLNKRAKSRHDSAPWPRRIFVDCWREKPFSKGDLGCLIIDIEKAAVYYESKYGKSYARTTELKQVDIRAPDIAVLYSAATFGHDEATRILDLLRPGKEGISNILISLHCEAPTWKTWYCSATKPSKKIYLSEPEVVVDALVHCIDRASGREAVHDPETDHKLRQERAEFLETQKASTAIWGARAGRQDDAEWVALELERREAARAKARIYEPGKEGVDILIPY
ncbi:hypothetical protein EKO04_003275 [Ascochyta lentis]|uniref:Uncharacterized protein n=1 Tax=Ascochyta lentis TaxID=205686 RepID=A0A8H7J6W8_9PLEO|nr:hypothetical protein EKO04_003275 [Ascochyta lentis]